MLIGIDESGSFVRSTTSGSWCVVAAYTLTERSKTKNLRTLLRLKASSGLAHHQEVKLRGTKEATYFEFLANLKSAGGALFAVATDGALAQRDGIEHHRAMQAEKVRSNAIRMIHPTGKLAVQRLADELESLSTQLYLQLVCQVTLMHDVVKRAILFYVQRDPKTLRRFVWRIDQKNVERSTFEVAFRKVVAPLLQSMSLSDPCIHLNGADYSHFREFEFAKEEYPTYLQTEFGFSPEPGVDVVRLLGDMSFPKSTDDEIVQIADLLSAGIRRCLRGQFADNKTAARLLGGLLVQNISPRLPLALIQLAGRDSYATDHGSLEACPILCKYAQPMVHQAARPSFR